MKVEPQQLVTLLTLQDLDLTLDRLRRLGRNLPEAETAAKTAAQADRARDEAAARRTEAGDLSRELRKVEDEVERVRARAARDAELLQSGTITSAKQLQDLEHEIASLGRRQRNLEDHELELMEGVEAARTAQSAAEADHLRLAQEAEAAEDARKVALAEVMRQGQAATIERRGVAAAIDPALLELYETTRRRNGGVGAVRFQNGQCGACRLAMVPADLAEITSAPLDEVIHCDECGRILVRVDRLRS